MTAAIPLPRLVCPPIGWRDLQGAVRSLDHGRLGELSRRYPTLASCFGLELKVTWLLERAGAADDQLRRAYYRLAQEPIIASYWPALQQGPLTPAAMLALASMLNGAEVDYRVGEIVSLMGARDDHLLYESVAQGRTWLADIAAVEALSGDPVKQALYRFARIVIAHPFTDANGRVARAVLQGALARGGLIAAPCLALAPAFWLGAGEIRLAFRALSDDGGWPAHFELMGGVLSEASNFALRQVKYTTEIPV